MQATEIERKRAADLEAREAAEARQRRTDALAAIEDPVERLLTVMEDMGLYTSRQRVVELPPDRFARSDIRRRGVDEAAAVFAECRSGSEMAALVDVCLPARWGHGANAIGVRLSFGRRLPSRQFARFVRVNTKFQGPTYGPESGPSESEVVVLGHTGRVVRVERTNPKSNAVWRVTGDWGAADAVPGDVHDAFTADFQRAVSARLSSMPIDG